MKASSDNAPTANEPPILVRPSRDTDVEAMLSIYRRHIRRGIEDGVDESGMPGPDDLLDRRKNFRNHRLPHLVATIGGEVVGYAYIVLFRKRPAYRFTVKHSIYVHQDHRRRGVGRVLMQQLIDACAAARVSADNRLYRCRQRELLGHPREIRLLPRRPVTRRGPPPWPMGRHCHGPAFAGCGLVRTATAGLHF